MLKKHKNKIVIITLAIVGIALILLGNIDFSKKNEENNELSQELYTTYLEEKIEAFLLSVRGISNVNVVITLDNSSEFVYAQNDATYDFLKLSGEDGESAVYVTEIYPRVRGIAIACTNGDSDEVKMKVTALIQAYLGISSNRIQIVSFG